MKNRSAFTIVAWLMLAVLSLSACMNDDDAFESGIGAETQPPAVSDAPDNLKDETVELEIFEGPDGSIMLFVPVYIQGEGPFDFVLDTGASRSVIDTSVADQFDFPQADTPGDVTGVGGTAEVEFIEMDGWSIGPNVALPQLRITTFPVFEDQDAAQIESMIGREIQGLLGSDVLSHFGVITIDFEQSRLIIGR